MVGQIKYAGFWLRLMASVIDSIVMDIATLLFGLVCLGAIYWIEIILGWHSTATFPSFSDFFNPFHMQLGLVLIQGGLSILYYTWMTYRCGTTLGKRVFRIYVVKSSDQTLISRGQSLIRCLAYLLSYLPFGAGYLMAAFHPEKRALHDLIAGTICIVRPQPMVGGTDETSANPFQMELPIKTGCLDRTAESI
jgi:uncharacterized RDD family membrane protein YckC